MHELPAIDIHPEDKKHAEICLKILGGIIHDYDKCRKYSFRIWINTTEYYLDKESINNLRRKLIREQNFSTRQFHNLMEEALGLPLNSTLL